MKSKNHLSITGFIATDVTFLQRRRLWRFYLIHHFGGHNPSLFLQCVFSEKRSSEILALCPKKGDAVTIEAYVRPDGERIEAVLKYLSIIPEEEVTLKPDGE